MAGSKKSRSRKSSGKGSRKKSKSTKSRTKNAAPKGELGQYRYSSKDSVEKRRRALKDAIIDLGVKKVRQILNLIRNYNKSNHDLHDRMTADMEWLKGQQDD
jgi:hypothetical protein